MYVRALEIATKACASARQSGDAPTLALALRSFAYSNTQLERFADADRALTEAAAISPVSPRLQVTLTEGRALLSSFTGELDAAAASYDELLSVHRSLDNERGVLAATVNLAELEHRRGRTAHAAALVRDVLPAARTGVDAAIPAMCLANLAGYVAALGDLRGAVVAARETLAILARQPDHFLVSAAIGHLALVDALRSESARATRLSAYMDFAFLKVGNVRGYTEQTTYDRIIALLDRHIARDERDRLVAEGRTLLPAAAIALALQIEP